MPSTRRWTLALFVVWLLCGLYAIQFVHRGWIPHDEGTIGQSAERVLAGQVPHRDFDEVYTGGLTYLHAAGMKAFGLNLRTPRLIVFVFFMAFLLAVYAIGRRVASPAGGLCAMVLAATWSLPNYFVSLPSWYNLFFAAFGVVAFLQYLDARRRRWLVAAGVCGGLSVLAKISGLSYVAGGLLFLTYLEQHEARTTRPSNAEPSGWRFVVATGAMLVLALVAAVFVSGVAAPALMPLVAPAVMAGLFVAWSEWTLGSGQTLARLRQFCELCWPFVAGAALPVVAFVLLNWSQDALPDLVRGVFILPQRRLGDASWNPPVIATWGLAAPYLLLLLAGRRHTPARETLAASALTVVLATALVFGALPMVHTSVLAVARAMTMVAVVGGMWLIAIGAKADHGLTGATQLRLFLLIVMAATVALVQFPYGTPTYFFYAAPMTALAILAVAFARQDSPRAVHLSVAAFFLIFAVVFTNRSYVGDRDVTAGFAPYRADARLDLERGGLWVPARDKETYEGVVNLLKTHAVGGTIYAGPDCPEIYFLSGFPNPTRAIFDFLTPTGLDAPAMADLLEQAPIRAVVINTGSRFSRPLDADVLSLLENRFPSSRQIGRFLVRFE
jgi:hypothetical protein